MLSNRFWYRTWTDTISGRNQNWNMPWCESRKRGCTLCRITLGTFFSVWRERIYPRSFTKPVHWISQVSLLIISLSLSQFSVSIKVSKVSLNYLYTTSVTNNKEKYIMNIFFLKDITPPQKKHKPGSSTFTKSPIRQKCACAGNSWQFLQHYC